MSIIEEYRKIKPNGTFYTYNEDISITNKTVSLIADGIDLGTHSASSLHKEAIYRQLARRIGEIVDYAETSGECMVEDGVYESYDNFLQEIGDKLILIKLKNLRIQCPYCSENLPLELDENRILRVSKNIDKEVKDNCFEFKKYSYEIQTKSDKFVFMNDIRRYIKTPDRLKENNINSHGGTMSAIEAYAKDNIFCAYVGNSGVVISQEIDNENSFHIFENGFFNNDVETRQKLTDIGSVCCDLWWVMGADIKDLDMDEIQENQYDPPNIVYVEPNSTYIFEIDMTVEAMENDGYNPKRFKFYKKD